MSRRSTSPRGSHKQLAQRKSHEGGSAKDGADVGWVLTCVYRKAALPRPGVRCRKCGWAQDYDPESSQRPRKVVPLLTLALVAVATALEEGAAACRQRFDPSPTRPIAQRVRASISHTSPPTAPPALVRFAPGTEVRHRASLLALRAGLFTIEHAGVRLVNRLEREEGPHWTAWRMKLRSGACDGRQAFRLGIYGDGSRLAGAHHVRDGAHWSAWVVGSTRLLLAR